MDVSKKVVIFCQSYGEIENFVGVTVPYEESDPELVLDTHKKSIEECSRILVRHALDFINSHNP